MDDRTLIIAALAISGVGIAGLLLALIFLDVPLAGPAELEMAADGQMVRVRGEVVRVRQGEPAIISVSQRSTLDIVVDGGDSADMGLQSGDCIIVQGKKGEFRDRTQVSAARIERCR